MPENPEAEGRYCIYREIAALGIFEYVGQLDADSAKGALADWLSEYDGNLSDGMRFAVRRRRTTSGFALFMLKVPQRTFGIVSA